MRQYGGPDYVWYVKFDADRRAVGMLNPMRNGNEGMFILGGKRGKTPVTTACSECRCGLRPPTSCAEPERKSDGKNKMYQVLRKFSLVKLSFTRGR